MKKHLEALGTRRCGAALLGIALIVVFAAGCDSRVDVRGPRITLPTVPPIPTVPSGPTVTESRPIAGVHTVALDAVGHVRIALGATESLTISAPESVMDLLTAEVIAGRLVLDRESESYQGQASDIQYEIGLVRLDELILGGVGRLEADGINGAEFRVDHSGVGDIHASGKVDRQEVALSGLGDYMAPELESRVTRVNMASGHAVVWASERIEGWVGAGCRLEYWGSPTLDVSGPGRVERRGAKP